MLIYINLNNIIFYIKFKYKKVFLKKEMIMLFKNPIYFMQCVLPAFLLPIIFAIVFFAYSFAIIADFMKERPQ